MGLIVWDSRVETGHPKIDEQHKELINAFNRLHTAMKQGKGKDELAATLGFLQDYTATHFAMEETLMADSGYPGTARHQAIHADLLAQVKDLVERFHLGASLTLKVMDFLEGWLMVHIQGEDCRLSAYLRGKA